MANTNDKTNVSAAKPKVGGAAFRAPVGTTIPTDTTTVLDEAFKNLGYISEDGLSNDNSFTSEDIKAWGGDIVDSVTTETTDTFTFTLIESMREEVLKMAKGDDNVTGTADTGITIKANSNERDYQALVFEMVLKGNKAKRVVIPCCKVTSVSEIVYNDTDPVGYQLTVTAYPDENGNTHYEYIK